MGGGTGSTPGAYDWDDGTPMAQHVGLLHGSTLEFSLDWVDPALYVLLCGPYDWAQENDMEWIERADWDAPSGEPVSTTPPFLEVLLKHMSEPLPNYYERPPADSNHWSAWQIEITHGLDDGHCCFAGHDIMNCGCCRRSPAVGCHSAHPGCFVTKLGGADIELW